MIRNKGATSQSIYVVILDSTSTTGGRKTGLAFNTAGLTAYYVRSGGSATAITLATLAAANSAWSSGGFKEVDATNMPGVYRLDIPDAALASGADSVIVTLKGATGMVQVDKEIELTSVNLQDAVRGGMTALPNANAEAAGGLYTRGSGAGQINQPANGQIDTNTVKVGGTVQTARDLGASVLISSGTGTGQLDVTSGVIKANLAQILGTALTETAGQIAAAFKQFFNIASPTSTMNTITTVTTTTTATNLTNAPTNGDFTAAMKTSLNAATPSVTVSDKTGFSLSAAGIQAIWDALTSALTTANSIGKLLVDNINATISSRSTYAGGAVASVTGSVGSVASGGISAASFAAGAIDNAAIAADAIGSSELAASAVAEIADGVWDELIAGHLGAGSTGAALNAAGSAGDPWTTPLPGAYGAGTAGNIIGNNLDVAVSSRSTLDGTGVQSAMTSQGYTTTRAGYLDTLNGLVQAIWDKATSALTVVGSIGKLLVDNINATISSRSTYAGTDTAGTTTLLSRIPGTVQPQTGDSYARLGAPVGASISADVAGVQADTDNIQTRLPAALVSGRIDASVGAMATDVITATAIATDAIGANEISAAAVTKIQAGLSTYAGGDTSGTTTLLGRIPGTVQPQTGDSYARIGAAGVGLTALGDTRIANLDATVSSRSTLTSANVWAYVVEGALTAQNVFRLILASVTGKLSGAATNTIKIRDVADTKDRITATVDADGNRSSVTLDGS